METMQEFYHTVLPFYGIVSADYQSFAEDVPMIDRTQMVLENFKTKLLNFHKKKFMEQRSPLLVPLPEDYTVDDARVLILWKNAPVTDYFSDVNDHLIYTFCKKYFSDPYTSFNYRLYIDSADTLAFGSMTNFIRRIYIIHHFGGNRPFFMDDLPFFQYNEETLKAEALYQKNETLHIQMYERNAYFFNHTLQTFENMMAVTGSIPVFDELENNFISQYFKWQKGLCTISDCCNLLGTTQGDITKPMSRSAFYRLVAIFEKTPIYAEYLKLHPELAEIPRVGTSSEILHFMEDYNETVTDDHALDGKMALCRKYGFVSLSDLNRNYLSMKRKASSKRRKNK